MLQRYYKLISLVFILSLLPVGVFIVSRIKLNQRPVGSHAQDEFLYPKKLRIMEIIYLPPDSGYAGKVDLIRQTSDKLKSIISRSSAFHDNGHPSVNVEVVHPGFLRNTYRPDPGALNSNGDERKLVSLSAILNDLSGSLDTTASSKSPCQIIKDLSIDQIWLWVDPNVDHTPGSEYMALSPNSNWGNFGSNIEVPVCTHGRSFTVMGFQLDLSANFALHSFTHMIEGITQTVEGDDLAIDRFRGVYYQSGVTGIDANGYKLSELCGNVHTPPNSIPYSVDDPETPIDERTLYAAYQYDNANQIMSSCMNWNPDGTGQKTAIDASVWNSINVDMLSAGKYFMWWMQNMPNIGNSLFYKGKPIPNWWDFIVDTDNTIVRLNNLGFYLNPYLIIPSGLTGRTCDIVGYTGGQAEFDCSQTP